MSNLPKEFEFFTFLLTQYAEYRKTSPDKILKKWDKLNLTDYIHNMYQRYHTEALENAFEDIDTMIDNRS